MYVNSIGLQTIMATTGTSRQSQTPRQDNPRTDDAKTSDLRVTPAKGIGKNVDKSV